MSTFNRLTATLAWLFLLLMVVYFAITPLQALEQLRAATSTWTDTLQRWQAEDSTNFMIGQAALVVVAMTLFGILIWLEIVSGRRRGVRIRTAEGGSAELAIDSIGSRLQWHLDQLAEIITVVPLVKSRGGSVDIKLEIEAAPDVDIPMKTDEVVEVTRDIVEHDMGLRLGKLDVHMRCAPFEPEWN